MPETILLVEDKDVLREMVRTALVKAGHRVEEAHDGKTALEKIRARRFRLSRAGHAMDPRTKQ